MLLRWRLVLLHRIVVQCAEISQDSQLFRQISSSLNSTWEDNVRRVCVDTAAASGVSNAARVMACYNVAAIDEITGLFAADVRLYSVAQSQLGSGASIRLNIDFGPFATMQSIVKERASNDQSGTMQKRSARPGIIQDLLAARKQRQQQGNKQQTAGLSTNGGTKNPITNTQVFNFPQTGQQAQGAQAFADPSPGPPIRAQPAPNGAATFSVPSPGSPIQAQAAAKPSTPQQSQSNEANSAVQPNAGQLTGGTGASVAQSGNGNDMQQKKLTTQAGVAAPAAGLVAQTAGNIAPLSTDMRPVATQSGSQAKIASPADGLLAQSATEVTSPNAGLSAPAAILPGEKSINLLAQQSPSMASAEQGDTQIPQKLLAEPSPVLSFGTPGQEVERFQFVARANMELANGDPRNIGVRSALLPRIQLVVQRTGQEQFIIDMSSSTRQYLIGITGSSTQVGTSSFAGRKLGGADGSTSLTGLYIVATWVILFSSATISGLFSRISHRSRFRRQLRASRLRV